MVVEVLQGGELFVEETVKAIHDSQSRAPIFPEDLMVWDSGRISENYGLNFPLVLPLNWEWEVYQH